MDYYVITIIKLSVNKFLIKEKHAYILFILNYKKKENMVEVKTIYL